jgi:aryl-alcohol dehydrogenase
MEQGVRLASEMTSTTVAAAVLREPEGTYDIEDLNLDTPLDDEVLVRILAAGMCASDSGARRPGQNLPAVLGHEGAGIVVQVGASVEGLTVGDHVILSFDFCGHCPQCLNGSPHACVDFFALNGKTVREGSRIKSRDRDGNAVSTSWFGQSSFATHSVVRAVNAIRVSPSVPLEVLAPLGCGVQTGAGAVLNGLRVPQGASFAVLGAGAVGLAAVMGATIAGASEILAVDLNPERLALARELGATKTLQLTPGGDPDEWRTQIGSWQYILDTTGSPSLISTAILCLEPGGTCGLVSAAQPLTISPRDLAGRRLTLLVEGNADPQVFIPQLVSHWQAGRLPVEKLIKTYPLSEINQAEQDARTGVTVKPVLIP